MIRGPKISRRGLLAGAAAAGTFAALPWYWRAAAAQDVKPLSGIIDEAQFDFRDRMPEDFSYNWQRVIRTADGRSIGEGAPQGPVTPKRRGAQIAVIGAGAAGLCAAYELMKLGYEPVIYEFQVDPTDTDFIRPMGRGYSWNYTITDPAAGTGGGFTDWHPQRVDGPGPVPDGQGGYGNISPFGHQTADLGAMRYPLTHVALHTYCDEIFDGSYYYGTDLDTKWPIMRNPAVFQAQDPSTNGPYGKPQPSDKLLFPTVLYANGLAGAAQLPDTTRGFYRMEAGQTLGEVNPAIGNVSRAYWDLMLGAQPAGVLRDLVTDYIHYTENPNKRPVYEARIKEKWFALNQDYQKKSLYQVLDDAGWNERSAYEGAGGWQANPARPSLLEMFGSVGIGSGGFNVFWWTTFMESLRITLHKDEGDQQAFVGGTSYMLSPFLTRKTERYDGREVNLWSVTQGKVVTDPVVAVRALADGRRGVRITTRAADGTTDTKDFAACIMTAAPTAVRSRIAIDPDLMTNAAQLGMRNLQITNSGKIAINFPNIENEKYSKAFWFNPETPRSSASDDSIVTTITDSNIRQIYTFDNYYWGYTTDAKAGRAGTLMLSYTWDYNSDSFAPMSTTDQVRSAWDQMKEIYADPANVRYPLPDDADAYMEWALSNNQAKAIVWSIEDGFAGGYRMADVGRNDRDNAAGQGNAGSEQYALWMACQTSRNADTGRLTGFFPAGEAISWLGLSGWVEGAIQTALAATIGVVRYLNGVEDPLPERNDINGKSFSVPMLPGDRRFTRG